MASCKCGATDDRPGAERCDCENKIGNDDPIDGASVASPDLAQKLAERTIRAADQHGKAQVALEMKLSGRAFDEIDAIVKQDSSRMGLMRLDENTIDMSGIVITRDTDSTHVSAANNRQVAGNHYGGGAIQHWDLAVMFKWNWAQYQITKYVMRYLKKNGLQDLEKAQHFIEKLIEEVKAGRMPEKEV